MMCFLMLWGGAFNELGEWSVGALSYRFCFICGIHWNTTDVVNGANLKYVFWFRVFNVNIRVRNGCTSVSSMTSGEGIFQSFYKMRSALDEDVL